MRFQLLGREKRSTKSHREIGRVNEPLLLSLEEEKLSCPNLIFDCSDIKLLTIIQNKLECLLWKSTFARKSVTY